MSAQTWVGLGILVGALGLGLLRVSNAMSRIEGQLERQQQELREQRSVIDSLARVTGSLPTAGAMATACRSCLTLDELREEYRAQQGSSLAATSSAATTGEVPATSSPTTAVGEVARDDSLQLVEQALARGLWKEDDAARFRGLLGQMNGAQRDEAQGALFRAITQQKLRVERQPL
jgi:hypothetical protein